MTTLESLRRKKHAGPVNTPLRVLVAAVSEPKPYGPTQEKKMLHASVCDATDKAKAVLFDTAKFQQFKPNDGLILHNAIYKNEEIIVTSQTRVFKTSPHTIPESLLQEAVHIIRPPAPPTRKISEAKRSPAKVRVSIRGKVTTDGLTTTVMSHNREVQVKTITLEDQEDHVKVSLWRDFSQSEISLGDIVEITHVVINEKRYGNEDSLSTTQFTTITKTEMPSSELTKEVIGIEIDDTTCTLMTEDMSIFKGTNEMLTTALHCTIEELPNKFPCTLTVTVKDQEILEVRTD